MENPIEIGPISSTPGKTDGLNRAGLLPWQRRGLEHLLRKPKRPFRKAKRTGGRPRVDDWLCFEAVLWVLRTGASWNLLPEKYGGRRTVFRRLLLWQRDGRLRRLWLDYLATLGRSDLDRWQYALRKVDLRRRPWWQHELCAAFRVETGRRKW